MKPPETAGELNMKTDVSILGAGGFTGRELLKILAQHPHMRPAHITSDKYAGKPISEVFPDLADLYKGSSDIMFSKNDAEIPAKSPVFLAVPNDTSLKLVPSLLSKGHKTVDLSGSYRLHNKSVFEKYYKLNHDSWNIMKHAVYGLPEIFRADHAHTDLISNPGCYTTSAILPLYFLGEERKKIQAVSVASGSGVSGAGGRVEDGGFSFQSVHENYRAYKILSHQHQPEIEEYGFYGINSKYPAPADLFSDSDEKGEDLWNGHPPVPFNFTPHLLPLYRGILTTTTVFWKEPPADLTQRFRGIADTEPFIRFYNTPEEVELSKVQNTNFLDIGLRTEGLITVMVSALDNLRKGAAGQAVQNMNLLLGFPETSGLLL
jgi:N-acetyl-gamma-glutamyl-phosphate reductase